MSVFERLSDPKGHLHMPDFSQITLQRVTDDHFAFLLGEQTSPLSFAHPPGGIDSPGMLRMLRRMVARLHNAGCDGHWLILDGKEAVGLCGYKAPPSEKSVEIGYGIAPERRKMGYATKAISLLLKHAYADQAVDIVTAETAVDNPASRIVLERNGFTHVATREDSNDGVLDMWQLELVTNSEGAGI
jgi:RimJ/RimL family protein N-acetyltransferase